jgi:hypothetical protein
MNAACVPRALLSASTATISRLRWIVLAAPLGLASIGGCASACATGGKAGKTTFALPWLVAKGCVDGWLERDETAIERDRREQRDRQWKQHWRDHPDENHAMHEAFRDDFD